MPKAGVASLLFLAATAVIPGLAQDAALPPVAPTIRVTTTEVALDLVVRDKKGRQVKNVKPGDVEIYEDGVRQQLLSFRMVPVREQARREESQPAANNPDAAAPAGIKHGLHCFSQYRSGDPAACHRNRQGIHQG